MSGNNILIYMGVDEHGKTTLANFLSEAGEVGGGEYRPTKGCRIIEFEVPNVSINGLTTRAEVELWDVSGDRRFENCWPAIQRGAQGVVFVYSPGRDDHARSLDGFYTHFLDQNGLRETQAIVFCHHKPGANGKAAKLSSSFNQIPQIDTQLDEDSGRVRTDFTNFISSVLGQISEAAERQENFILHS
ncbi:unnamed protein product, partial [Meganyctiphanes norvegica]